LALLIPPFLASAFERMGSGNKSLEQIAVNTKETAASVSVGGDLYQKMDELVKALKSGGGGKGKVSIKEALVLRITAGALEPIGLGLGVIIDALERAPEGKELKLKMEALTNGLLALGDIGWSILKFAALMILALPLLIIAGVAMLLIVPLLKLMVDGLMWATSKLDEKGLERITALGDVGKALLWMSVSLVLMALLAPQILQGLLVAGVVLLGFGLIMMLLDKMKLDSKRIVLFGKAIQSLALGVLFLSVSLVLIGLLAEYVLKGLGVAALVILTIGGVFWLMDKMQVDKAMKKTGMALMFAAGAILSIAIALVLSHLILSSIGFEEIAKVMLVVGGVALVFGLIAKKVGDVSKGAMALILCAVAIVALSLAIWIMNMILGDMKTEDVIKTVKSLAVVAGVALVFALAGEADKQIKNGAQAMMWAAGSLVVLAIGVWAMKSALNGASWETLAMMGAVIVGLGVAMGVAGLADKEIEKGSAAMIVASIAMVTIAIGVFAMKKALDGVTWENLGMMGAVIVGLAVAMGVAGIGPIPVAIALGSAAMIVAGVALITLGLGTKMFMVALKDATWEKVGMMGAVIVGVGLAFAGAGFAAPFIVIGAAAMGIAGLALLPIALGVLALSKLPIAEMFAPKGLFGDSGNVTKGFLGIGGGRAMTNMEVMFEAIANSFSLGPLQIAALYVTSPALIMAGVALITIAKGLQEFQKIAAATDLMLLGVNVTLITTILANAFGEIGKKFPGGAAGLFTSGSFVSQGISSVMGMGEALTNIAMGMQNMANLKFPVKYDKDGKPTAYESMDSDAPARVAANTMTIVEGLSTVFGEVGKKYGVKKSVADWLFGTSPKTDVEIGIQSVMGMGGALTGIATGFQAMADLKFPIAWDKDGKPTAYAEVKDLAAAAQRVADNTRLIVTSLSSTFADIGKGQTSSWWGGDTDYEKGVSIVSGLGTPLKNLAEGVANMAEMKFATGYDKDGKATGWINLSAMSPDDIKAKIGTNTQKLIEALTSTFVAIGGGDAKESSWWQGATTFEKGVSIVNTLAKPYKTLTETVNSVIGFMDKKLDVTKLGTVVQGLFSTITNVGMLDNTQFWWGNGRMKSAGETYESFAGNIENSADEILDVDAVKLKENMLQLFSVFTTIGGSADPALLNAAKLLAYAVGNTYDKMASSLPVVVGAASKFNPTTGGMVAQLLFGKVDTGNAMNGYNAQTKMQLALATTYGKAGENFPKISSAINALDITKLTESRKMFEALAVLSKGGAPGDILAAMGTSLEDALKNLAEMLDKFKTTVSEGNEAQSGILKEVGNAVTGVKNAVTGGGGGAKPGAKETPATLPSKFTVDISRESIAALKKSTNLGGGTNE
jgi:hypothetical protein